MRRVGLVTGFGPFLDVAENPSGLLAERLDGAEVAGSRVHGRVLPVSHARSGAAMAALIAELRPDWVLALGAGRGLRVETCAENLVTSSSPDCDGLAPVGSRVDAAGPERRVMAPALAQQIPGWLASAPALRDAALSEDAGGYVCNTVYFALLASPVPRAALFVHLPRAADPASLALAHDAVMALIQRLGSQ